MRYIGTDPLPLLVSVDDYKAYTHMPPQSVGATDAALGELLGAAQELVCTAINHPPAAGPYEFTVPYRAGDWRVWCFPCRPVTGLVEIATDRADGGFVSAPLDDVGLIRGACEPQLVLPSNWDAPHDETRSLRIRATCGDDAIPLQARQAIRLQVKEWQTAGIAVEAGGDPMRLSFGVRALIRQVRYSRPQVTA